MTYDPILKSRHSLLLHHQHNFFHHLSEDLCLQHWQRGWQPLLRQIVCPLNQPHGGIELVVRKIEMGEDKNQNCIGPSLHNFCVNLHQNNPLKLVVLRLVRVIIANLLAGVNKLWHHWCYGTNAGTELWRLQRHSVKECQREDGAMRSMPWYISLRRNT